MDNKKSPLAHCWAGVLHNPETGKMRDRVASYGKGTGNDKALAHAAKLRSTLINYDSPLNQNKEKTYGPSQGGITKSVISTEIGPKENKGYTVENTTPKGLYKSDANKMSIKAFSEQLSKK